MEKIANGENVGRAKISAVSIDIGPGAGDGVDFVDRSRESVLSGRD